MVQEYIGVRGADIRRFVVGGKVIAVMKRQAAPGEFRSNLHRGGSASLIRITPKSGHGCGAIMGLNVAGVDILRSNHGPVVMEGFLAGLEGIERLPTKMGGMIIRSSKKMRVPIAPRPKAQKANKGSCRRWFLWY